jgi:hypothetical protein
MKKSLLTKKSKKLIIKYDVLTGSLSGKFPQRINKWYEM